jgi:hypothetical protein
LHSKGPRASANANSEVFGRSAYRSPMPSLALRLSDVIAAHALINENVISLDALCVCVRELAHCRFPVERR